MALIRKVKKSRESVFGSLDHYMISDRKTKLYNADQLVNPALNAFRFISTNLGATLALIASSQSSSSMPR